MESKTSLKWFKSVTLASQLRRQSARWVSSHSESSPRENCLSTLYGGSPFVYIAAWKMWYLVGMEICELGIKSHLCSKCDQERRWRSRSRVRSLLWKVYRSWSPSSAAWPLLDHPGPSAHSPLSFSLILRFWELVVAARISTNTQACVILPATAGLVQGSTYYGNW